MTIQIINGDCLESMRSMPENSVDAVVTDPPYGLKFMGKDWDHGLPGEQFWAEALRIAKLGCHLLAFGGTRTFHRLTCAIEDAGWEIRDCLGWLYGSGFPKSHNVGLRLDKLAGHADRGHRISVANRHHPDGTLEPNGELLPPYEGKTEEGKKWQGWGTALKPAWEPIVLARKPLDGTVAENVLKWGCGALNIDGCRVEGAKGSGVWGSSNKNCQNGRTFNASPEGDEYRSEAHSQGRWPANLIHDGSEEVVGLFPQTGPAKPHGGDGLPLDTRGQGWGFRRMPCSLADNGGSAARFFYCAKASRSEREAGMGGEEKPLLWSAGTQNPGSFQSPNTNRKAKNNHPTVKPVALMRYLCRLVTPPGGTILDPFAGSGSTGIAAKMEGFGFIGIEKEPDYCAIAEKRIAAVLV